MEATAASAAGEAEATRAEPTARAGITADPADKRLESAASAAGAAPATSAVDLAAAAAAAPTSPTRASAEPTPAPAPPPVTPAVAQASEAHFFDRAGTVNLNNVTFNNNSATGGASSGGAATGGQGKGGAVYILGTVGGSATFGVGGNANSASHALTSTTNPQDNNDLYGVLTVPGSTTSVAAMPNPSAFGQSLALTATVSSTGGTPAGTVTFMDGSTTLGTATLASGEATFTTSALSIGSHSITAVYAGSSSFAGSTSTASILTVDQAETTIAVTASPNPAIVGGSVALTATIASAGGTPSGTATFFDGLTGLGTATLAGGIATLNTSDLAAGPHVITAVYSGNSQFLASLSATSTLLIEPAASATTLSIAPTSSSYGALVTLSANVSANAGGTPTGSVSFTDGMTDLGTVTLAAGVAALSTSDLTPGDHAITATYSGDASHTASESSAATLMVDQVASAVVFTQVPTNAQTGTALSTVVVNVIDVFGNVVATYNSIVELAINTGPDGASLGGTVSVAAVNGVATFAGLTLSTAGAYALRVERGARRGDVGID